jgi:hypothetical protein
MNRDRRPRFDVDALRDLVGTKVYSRGEAYWRDGLVQLLTVGPKRVLAQVAGTEDYRVELKGRDGSFAAPSAIGAIASIWWQQCWRQTRWAATRKRKASMCSRVYANIWKARTRRRLSI